MSKFLTFMDNHYLEMKRNIGINLNDAKIPNDYQSDDLHKIDNPQPYK